MKESSLRVTNYNNFKDLSYFISQHKKALGMMDEVQNFYLSFLKSKLVHSYEISKWPGKLIRTRDVIRERIYVSKYSENKEKKLFDAFKKEFNNFIFSKTNKNTYPSAEEKHDACEILRDKFLRKTIILQLPDRSYYATKYPIEATISEIKDDDVDLDSWDGGLGWTHFTIEYAKPVKAYERTIQLNNDDAWRASIRKFYEDFQVSYKCRDAATYKSLCNLPNGDEMLKEELERQFKASSYDTWFIEQDSKLIEFVKEEDIDGFTFEIGEHPLNVIRSEEHKDQNEYLVALKKWKTSGNTTDRWKTFYRENTHVKALLFDISSGNLAEAIDTSYISYQRQLDVHNGWHPELDD